jgi:FkbM family methyltransferase
MKNEQTVYDFVLSIVPSLENDVQLNKGIIQTVTKVLDQINFENLGENSEGVIHSREFGMISFPFYSFGNVKSYYHLEYREFVLFAIYKKILENYSRFLDVGGNLGLHSIIASKLSKIEIHYIEPDPRHFEEAVNRFSINEIRNRIVMKNVAASNFDGRATFVRLNDNTTGSHLSGSRSSIFGPTENFDVEVSKLSKLISDEGKTLAKIDIEGAEFDALSDISDEEWEKLDAVVEITDIDTAYKIHNLASSKNLNIYSQKISWNVATEIDDLPHRWNEGSVLISKNLKRSDFLG